MIGGQRKEEEARGHQEHHACDFIQATVAGRGQCQFEWLHRGIRGACRLRILPGAAANSERQSGFIIPEISADKTKTGSGSNHGEPIP
jgi:hypothetical protein